MKSTAEVTGAMAAKAAAIKQRTSKQYLMCQGDTGTILTVNNPAALTSERWGELQRDFVRRVTPRKQFKSELEKYPEYCIEITGITSNDVRYNEELAGAGGISIVLFQLPEQDPGQIMAAMEEIKSQRDVVRAKVLTIKTLL